ncbi:MAG: hypothetical protein RMJ17_03780, partial [Candidatus Aenigmarchaeota archaeon]|nr:hypothetical protein [Candidatus Aenigmarchaeota archaeon]MDW8149682.1 hypothetical protein [Candidatus Aenigmarchaeota archaeon]
MFFFTNILIITQASTPSPNPPVVFVNPLIQRGGENITFFCPECYSGARNEYMKLLICKYNNSSCFSQLQSFGRYVRPITINNSLNPNNLTDYQILINLDTSELVSYSVYELPITINNPSSNNLIDYQVNITITNTTILSKITPDGRDIRVFNISTN